MSNGPPYNLKQRLLLSWGTWLGASLLRLLAFTWRTQIIAPPGAAPRETDGPVIYAMWHEDLIAIVGGFRDHAIQGLASQSFDGEMIARAMVHLGYPAQARGSSSRGGAQGISAQLQALALGRHVVVTMDGPRGPRRESKPGTALIGARSGRPLVPLVCEAKPAIRLRNWDRTLIPLPFAKVVFVFGAPLPIPRQGGDRSQAQLALQMAAIGAQATACLQER